MAAENHDADIVSRSHIDLQDRIRRRAEEIYKERGERPGSAVDDWLQAEREILGEDPDGQSAQDRGTVVGSAKKPDTVL